MTAQTSKMKDFYNPQSTHYSAINYSSASEFKSLSPYTSADALFDNLNDGDCGSITTCTLKPKGCGAGAYTGKLKIVGAAQGIEATQNVAMGYTEELCVECANSAGSST